MVRGRTLIRTGTAGGLSSCRSQIAGALLEHYAQGRARAGSAGSAPAAEIQPEVLAALRERGIDISGRFPKHLTDEALDSADLIITLGCGDAFIAW